MSAWKVIIEGAVSERVILERAGREGQKLDETSQEGAQAGNRLKEFVWQTTVILLPGAGEPWVVSAWPDFVSGGSE